MAKTLLKKTFQSVLFTACAVMFLSLSSVQAQEQDAQPIVEAPNNGQAGDIQLPTGTADAQVNVTPLPENVEDADIPLGTVEDTITPLTPEAISAVAGNAVPADPLNPNDIDINPEQIPSLLFTFWEHNSLIDAMKRKGFVSTPTQTQLNAATGGPTEFNVVEPGIRELKLSGIVYKDKKDWTIWFNNQKVTPKILPDQVLDLVVHKEYIDVKWFDAYTNQIFPIRLRPHQRFNLDSRIFLPGQG